MEINKNLSDEELQKIWSGMEAKERYMISLRKFESIKEKVKDENLARAEHKNWVDKMWGEKEDDSLEKELQEAAKKNEAEKEIEKPKYEESLEGSEKEDYLKIFS